MTENESNEIIELEYAWMFGCGDSRKVKRLLSKYLTTTSSSGATKRS